MLFGGGNSCGFFSVLCQAKSQIVFFLTEISYNSMMYCSYLAFNACFFLLFQLVILVQPITFWQKQSAAAGSLCVWQCFLLYFPLNSLDNFVIWYSLLLDQLDIWWAVMLEMPSTWQVTLWQRNYNIKMEQIGIPENRWNSFQYIIHFRHLTALPSFLEVCTFIKCRN